MRKAIVPLGFFSFLACTSGGTAQTVDGSIDDASVDAPVDAAGLGRLMYVSTGGAATLDLVRLEVDGTMTAVTEVDVGANTSSLVLARTARRLYVGTTLLSIATFALDDAGMPTLLGSTPNTGNPTYLAMANDDAHLVAAYFATDDIASYTASGFPPHAEVKRLATANEPHAVAPGPGGRIYVPHRTANSTHWYDIDSTGDLTYVGEVAAPAGVGPRHIAFSPDENFAYVVNEIGDSVTAHTVAVDGSLTPIQTISTLPEGVSGASNNCADIHVTPNGQFVYASNRGHDSIAMFAVQADGSLVFINTVATETTPREFDVSPAGDYVVVAGENSGFLQSYAIGSDGVLTPVAVGIGVSRLQVGGTPRWVVIE